MPEDTNPDIGQQTRPETAPVNACDIVMKGGITSGVVYPLALVELSTKFRFSNIGGTSAGAIAAAIAAAAEFGRGTPNAGFDRLRQVPNEIGPRLLSLFQPAPPLRPIFNIFLALLKAKGLARRAGAAIPAALCGYRRLAIAGAIPGLIIAVLGLLNSSAGFVLFGLTILVLGIVAGVLWGLVHTVLSELPKHDYGLCPGIRQAASDPEGFADWLADLIDQTAGVTGPLTFGALANRTDGKPAINLEMVTTSLMERHPYTLPMLHERRFVFERAEWAKLFPARVLDYLVSNCDPFQPRTGESGDFYYFPPAEKLPLVVAARMSLSFPGLICAVPLWQRDFTLEEAEKDKLRRCLFSDGGLSSNFPIHFFDKLLPNTPTFAISLDAFNDKSAKKDPVWLPESAGSGINLPIQPIDGIFEFVMRLIDSAKDWQDNLQSTLSGYRERIVHIVLKPNEGGLNLAMDQETIKKLTDHGEAAGKKLCDDFDFDEHRWRRFLVSMARMEETLDDLMVAYDGLPPATSAFKDFLAGYATSPASYRQTPAVLASMLERATQLATLGQQWRAQPTIRSGAIPKPATNFRITPKY